MILQMPRPLKHPKTGVYYFRMRVPRDLVRVLGRAEVKFSLATKDPVLAKELFSDKERQVSEGNRPHRHQGQASRPRGGSEGSQLDHRGTEDQGSEREAKSCVATSIHDTEPPLRNGQGGAGLHAGKPFGDGRAGRLWGLAPGGA